MEQDLTTASISKSNKGKKLSLFDRLRKHYSPPTNDHINEDNNIKGVKRALLIGINYFESEYELHGCINDASNIKRLLVNSYNYLDENIILLSDDKASVSMPTKQNIIDSIDYLVSLTQPGDTLFVFYSGHGIQIKDVDGDETYNGGAHGFDDALCPCDFNDNGFILDDLLKEILVNKIVAGAKLRVFFDCCHSGSALDLPFLYESNKMLKIEDLNKKSSNCLLISGCKDSQTSADANINNQYSGALTWAIIQTLMTSANITTTWKEFLLIMQHNLSYAQYTQVPMLSVGDKRIADMIVDL